MIPTVPDQPGDVRTPTSEFWRKFKKQRVAMVAAVFVVLLILVAVLAPVSYTHLTLPTNREV